MKEEKRKCRRPRAQERNMGQEEETEKRTKDEIRLKRKKGKVSYINSAGKKEEKDLKAT